VQSIKDRVLSREDRSSCLKRSAF